MADWYTKEEIREAWDDAPDNDDLLQELLDVAQSAVINYCIKKYVVVDDEPVLVVSTEMRSAHRVQTRNTWNATMVSPSGSFGEDSYVVQPHPLDWHVEQILRPKSAVPKVGVARVKPRTY